MDKAYDHKKVEDKIYEKWLKSGYFKPENLPDAEKRKPYTITMPPPNVTGTLHIGHALFVTIQDIFIRWQRMSGKKALWLPGTDHAAIATQAKVEAELYKKEKKTRQDFPREEFLKMVEKYAQESHDTIINQLKRLGASADWSREAYTLDEQRTLAVRTAFKKMHGDGIIYKGARIVNWDPKLKTTVSDDEIQYVEQTDPFYHFKYGPFEIGTVRPETKFGDKYVVMHPNDERYKQYKHGQKIELEWINGKITATIIKDEAADMNFGSGAMTITPAHSAIDFEIAERHKLDIEQVIDDRGILLPIAGEFAGQHIKKARAAIAEKLKSKGLLVKIDEKYKHNIATNSRGGGIIEPQIKEQWFINVNKKFKFNSPSGESKLEGIQNGQEVSLKEMMRSVVESGEIKIVPEHFSKIYFHWIDNLRDWCISRQIWYGHRIPVWYRPMGKHPLGSKEIYCDIKPPKEEGWEQDSDTLDTWFSSGLWTFSTLGWPKETSDLKTFHPTDLMETGYDILFFWVARMILMTTYHLGEVPFKTVFLHGLVRDKDRQKMSKSKGNVIDPLGVIDLYGTDALRFALIFSTSAGNDIPLSEDKIKGMKHFANKLWNISRFVLTNLENHELRIMNDELKQKTDADKEILAKLNTTIELVTNHLENYRLHEAAQEIYQFTWHEFADIYIEKSKEQLKDESLKENTQKILLYSLCTILKLLHPFMPFITEEIWDIMGQKELLIIANWP
jgi:valyl-tRNA synthetase